MAMSRTRKLLAVTAAVALLAAVPAAPALAEDPPPLVWSDLPGYPVKIDGVEISWQTASSTTSPFGGEELLDPLPVLRVEIANQSSETIHLGLGTDLTTQGVVDHLWTTEAWGAFSDLGIESSFAVTLAPGQTMSADGGEASQWSNPLPVWSGHTLGMFELSEAPAEGVTPTATPFHSLVLPGGYVGANIEATDLESVSEIIGTRATVDGGGGSPDLFPGVTGSVTASGLTPGEELELWIAPDLDYFYFALLGGGLPVTATYVGSGTVQPDGTLDGTLNLPLTLPYGQYQLVAGVRAERYWPAGSYGDFEVTTPPNEMTVPAAPGTPATIDLGPTDVSVTLPATATGGTATATVSSTGPAADGFLLASDPPLYYHLSTTATFTDDVEVCFLYSSVNLPGPPPRIYHFDTAENRWVDITTVRTEGRVCGLTSSFSPFAMGYPEAFDFDGFYDPVSMSGPNVAKAGQAIPVTFSLGGDQGPDVVTSVRFVIEATVANPVGETLDATTAGSSGLHYDAATDRYTYVWKTDKAWAKKSGQFVMTLSDGTTHIFDVGFKK